MNGLIDFFKNLLRKLGLLGEGAGSSPLPEPPQPDPRKGVIENEPLLAYKDGHLVMIVDHQFEDVPSWVEWDSERKIVSITQMGGQMDEVGADIKAEHIKTLEEARKLLLVSNDNDEKIVHYVPFLTRN